MTLPRCSILTVGCAAARTQHVMLAAREPEKPRTFVWELRQFHS